MAKNTISSNVNTVYEKANSFITLSGATENSVQIHRLQNLRAILTNNISKEAILVVKACDDLLNPEVESFPKFELKPFILLRKLLVICLIAITLNLRMSRPDP